MPSVAWRLNLPRIKSLFVGLHHDEWARALTQLWFSDLAQSSAPFRERRKCSITEQPISSWVIQANAAKMIQTEEGIRLPLMLSWLRSYFCLYIFFFFGLEDFYWNKEVMFYLQLNKLIELRYKFIKFNIEYRFCYIQNTTYICRVWLSINAKDL